MTKCWTSVRDLSAYNRFPEGYQLVVLKSYFDGSGKSDDPDCGFLTLAAYAAPPAVWPAFEARWQSVLAKHGEPWIHMSEARYQEMPLLIAELLQTVELGSRLGMRTVAAAVDLAAYKAIGYTLPSPGRICVEFCINELLVDADAIGCFFDRGEEFYKEVERPWNSGHSYGQPWPQLEKVTELGLVKDQKDVPGIQAADLLAWHTNRSLTKSDHDIDLALAANRAPGVFTLFDVTALYALSRKA